MTTIPTPRLDDADILREFVATRSPDAFRHLVDRHLPAVHDAARRMLRPPLAHHADDIAQSVFILLAENAARIPAHAPLIAWLYKVTHYACRNLEKSERRRRQREAHAMRPLTTVPPTLSDAEALLDPALMALSYNDRTALLLRYAQDLSLSQIAQVTRVPEETAKKRLHRALIRIRSYFAAHGMLSAAPLALHALAPTPSANFAPITAAITAAALAPVHGTAGVVIAKGVATMMHVLTAAKIAAAIAVTVVTSAVIIEAATAPATPTTPPVASTPVQAPTTATPSPAPLVRLPYAISRETTRITGPLRPDGTIDYLQALNDKYSQGVTPQNNGFTAFLEAIGAGNVDLPDNARDDLFRLCGAHPAPGQLFTRYFDFLRNAKHRSPRQAFFTSNLQLPRLALRLWTPADDAEAADTADYLASQDQVLDAIVAAAYREKWWIPAIARDGRSLSTVYLSTAPFQHVIDILCARATLRFKAGDFPGFQRDIIGAARLARHLAGGFSSLHCSLGLGWFEQASKTIACVAASGALTQAQSAELLRNFDALGPIPSGADALDTFERWQLLDLLAEGKVQFDEDGNGNPSFLHTARALQDAASPEMVFVYGNGAPRDPSVFITGPEVHQVKADALDWNAAMKTVNQVYDQILADCAAESLSDWSQRSSAIQKMLRADEARVRQLGNILTRAPGESLETYSQRIGRFVALPNGFPPSSGNWEVSMEQQMTRVLLLAAQFKARTGQWPTGLKDLQAAGVPQLPRDVFSVGNTGKNPVIYKLTPRGPCIYSVGENGRDDRGLDDPMASFAPGAPRDRRDDITLGASTASDLP